MAGAPPLDAEFQRLFPEAGPATTPAAGDAPPKPTGEFARLFPEALPGHSDYDVSQSGSYQPPVSAYEALQTLAKKHGLSVTSAYRDPGRRWGIGLLPYAEGPGRKVPRPGLRGASRGAGRVRAGGAAVPGQSSGAAGVLLRPGADCAEGREGPRATHRGSRRSRPHRRLYLDPQCRAGCRGTPAAEVGTCWPSRSADAAHAGGGTG